MNKYKNDNNVNQHRSKGSHITTVYRNGIAQPESPSTSQAQNGRGKDENALLKENPDLFEKRRIIIDGSNVAWA